MRIFFWSSPKAPHVEEAGAASCSKLEWFVWESPARKAGRVSRVEDCRLVYVPPDPNSRVDYIAGFDDGSVQVLIKKARVRMIRRAGKFRPLVPWQA